MGKVVSHLVGVNSPDRPIPSKETQIDKNFNSLIATGHRCATRLRCPNWI